MATARINQPIWNDITNDITRGKGKVLNMPYEAIVILLLVILATAITRPFVVKQFSVRRTNTPESRDATGVWILASILWFFSVVSVVLMTLNYHLNGVITHDGGSIIAFALAAPAAVVLTIAAITKPRWATTYF